MYTSAISGTSPQPNLTEVIADQYGAEDKYIPVDINAEEIRFAITRRQEALQEMPDIKAYRKARLLLMQKIAELSVALGKLEDRVDAKAKAAEKRKKEAERKAAAREAAPKKKPVKRARRKAKAQDKAEPQEQSNLDEVSQ